MDLLFSVKFDGSKPRYINRYSPERTAQTIAEIKNLFHLIEFVPFIVCIKVLPFNGFTRKTNAMMPATKGISKRSKPILELKPNTLISDGFAAIFETTSGLDAALTPYAINNGIAPIVFDTINIAANITIYLQKLFFPLNADSR
jgi:hypothetical protein